MANEAQYEVLVPTTDYAGNPVPPMAEHAMAYIAQETGAAAVFLDAKHRVLWRGRVESFDSLTFVAEDTPEHDSTAKQLAHYLAETANQDVVLVTKRGKNGIQSWEIRNKTFHEEEDAAEDSVGIEQRHPHDE